MKEFPSSILSSQEIHTSSERITEILSKSLADDPYVSSLCTLLKAGNSDLSKALGRSLASDFTSVLVEKDYKRDMAFIAMRDMVSAYTHGTDAKKAESAAKIGFSFEKTGNSAYRLGYVEETSALNAFFEEMDTPVLNQAIASISAESWYTELKNAQQDFEKVYNNKVDTESKIDIPLMRKAKGRITKSLKAAMNYVETNAGLNIDKFQPVEQAIDEVIIDVVAIARARRTRKENKEEQAKVK